MIKELMHNYNDVDKFKESAKTAVTQFKNSDELLITATAGVNQKLSPRFQRLLLLHTSAQGYIQSYWNCMKRYSPYTRRIS